MLIIASMMCAGVRAAHSAELKVFAPRAVGTVLNELGSQFEKATGNQLQVTIDLTPTLVQRFRAGDRADVLIALPDLIDKLADDGLLLPETRTSLIKSGLGLEVRSGVARPDISSVEKFTRAILATKSIGYLKTPAGVHLDQEFSRLGIADQIASKAVRPDKDVVSQLVASGALEMGIVVSTQILTTPGVAFVGPLPAEIQYYVTFSGAIASNADNPTGGSALLAFLKSRAAAKVIETQGMQPE